jgi:hypothetical protein
MKKLNKNQLRLIGIFLLFFGISYFSFARFLPASSGLLNPGASTQIDNQETDQRVTDTGSFNYTGPKTEACPLNGQLYTKEEKAIWETRRPLLVMIENHENSRPQSGLQKADIVYEAVAEGGITRFMAVYYCGGAAAPNQKYDVGPVRSTRTYFLDWASEYSDFPLYAHVGGANCSATDGGPCTTNVKAQALEQISRYGWLDPDTRSDLNQFALSYKICRREPERTGSVKDTEHTMYCSTPELWNLAEERGLTDKTENVKGTPSWDKFYTPWEFKKDADSADRGPSETISFDFWSGYKTYSVSWNYNPQTNTYTRYNGGQEHLDQNIQKPLEAKTVIVQYAKETGPVDDHKHMLYETLGTGKAVVFQDGQKIDATWSKSKRTSRTLFKNSKGNDIKFNTGLIWLEILPTGSEIKYDSSQES